MHAVEKSRARSRDAQRIKSGIVVPEASIRACALKLEFVRYESEVRSFRCRLWVQKSDYVNADLRYEKIQVAMKVELSSAIYFRKISACYSPYGFVSTLCTRSRIAIIHSLTALVVDNVTFCGD